MKVSPTVYVTPADPWPVSSVTDVKLLVGVVKVSPTEYVTPVVPATVFQFAWASVFVPTSNIVYSIPGSNLSGLRVVPATVFQFSWSSVFVPTSNILYSRPNSNLSGPCILCFNSFLRKR